MPPSILPLISPSSSYPYLSLQHYGGSPIMAYDPVFNWELERAAVVGQRMPVKPLVASTSV